MAAVAGIHLVHPAPLIHRSSSVSWKKKSRVVRAKLGSGDGDDPLLQAAINRASLRFQETLSPEPLFNDVYAGCFVDSDAQEDMKQNIPTSISKDNYCLATKFIDDRLFSAVNHQDGVRQIVLFTDGMETRPYRLKWPNSSMLFDISPEKIFKIAAQKLEGVAAKIPKSCLLLHVPSESSNKEEMLCRRGFNGSRPSIWILQGLPLLTLASFIDVLVTVSSLAMKGCTFIGEFPAWLAETEILYKSDTQKWIDKVFMSNGFRVDVISYDEVAEDMGKKPSSGDCRNVLFVAEQLRLSDIQMESWRREFQRMEEEGDEDGFDEL